MKVFALSDLHLEHAQNRAWVQSLSLDAYRGDVLLLAGDVAESLTQLAWGFDALTARFMKVLFVPGNHELWVRPDESFDSWGKFDQVVSLAERAGVSMAPFRCRSLSVVPLLSWYDFSFGQPDAVLLDRWMDFRACRWPSGTGPLEVTQRFHAMNALRLQAHNRHVISFSHFLPRADLLPQPVSPLHAMLTPVLGSAGLEQQIRRLQPQLHVFGHSHAHVRVERDGITYLNQALGTPKERRPPEPTLNCIFDLVL